MRSSVFEIVVEQRLISPRHADAFRRYLDDPKLRRAVEGSMLEPHRVSLATLEGPPPPDMGQMSLNQKLYDYRGRFRAALDELANMQEPM